MERKTQTCYRCMKYFKSCSRCLYCLKRCCSECSNKGVCIDCYVEHSGKKECKLYELDKVPA